MSRKFFFLKIISPKTQTSGKQDPKNKNYQKMILYQDEFSQSFNLGFSYLNIRVQLEEHPFYHTFGIPIRFKWS